MSLQKKRSAHRHRNPFHEFTRWYDLALESQFKNPDAMTLATATRGGIPSARIVLFKGLDKKGIRFFTNYKSRKAKELQTNPRGALIFYWASLDRQIRIEGKIEKLSSKDSDQYWKTRPRESKIGAWASPQSRPIPNRQYLEHELDRLTSKWADQQDIPRPPHWGGFRLIPHRFEFWTAKDARLHERVEYQKTPHGWTITLLGP